MADLSAILLLIFVLIIMGISTGEKPTIWDGMRMRINNIECGK